MRTYLDFWIEAASALLPQALAGEPELAEALPAPLAAGAFGFAAVLKEDAAADVEGSFGDGGRFSVLLDAALAASPLLGEGLDQQAAWGELLRETAEAAAAKFSARTGKRCRVAEFEAIRELGQASRALQLRSGERTWALLLRDEVHLDGEAPDTSSGLASDGDSPRTPRSGAAAGPASGPVPGERLRPGLELLLDVELEASLRFGSRELPLGEILNLGPGDVVQLDRHVADPADLIVGDKIVARGEVVMVNGNFGLRVTEVAVPMKRLESIRCLF